MNVNIEELRSQYDSLLEEEYRLNIEINAVHDKQRTIIREFHQQLTKQFSEYLNKKVTIKKSNGRNVTGIFCGFTNGYNDLAFEACVDLAKIKKDGSPSVKHYPIYESVMFNDKLKITLCDE